MKEIFDIHIETLRTMDRELNRLHETLARNANGDDDVTQEQIGNIIDELTRLSNHIANMEQLLCVTNGNESATKTNVSG